MNDAPSVRLLLPARAEGVGVVRQALTGLADALAIDESVVSDAKMAVTEACTNAVVHAYPDSNGRGGVLEVDMHADDNHLTVVVRDQGSGIQPRPTRQGSTALGLGLPLIAALSDSFEVRGAHGSGTEVRMTFHFERDYDPADDNPITGGVGADGRWDLDAPAGA